MKIRLVLLFAFVLILPLQADVLPNDAIVDGKTIPEWSAEWWKWFLPISTNHNPMLDTNGAWAAVGQPEGDVFFLSLVLGLSPGTVTRHFTIPESKYLFFPALMYEADNVGSVPFTVEELRAQTAALMDSVRELHATIDGVELPNLFDHRAISPVFNLFYTNYDNIHSFAFPDPVTGLIDPMVSDGYWLMLEPLPPGLHVLHFGGTFSNLNFFPSDVVDYITVVPRPLSERVEELIASLNTSSLSRRYLRQLAATLDGAKKSFLRGHWRAGLDHLRAFQKRVRHQLGPTQPGLSEQLIQAAQDIIERARQDSYRRPHEN